ncbi:MAG: hypothetical protein M1834_006683 [Cirrosporium novae-zelandiae]|nr:MAG: hypothetical protein M1834_006683 [Cirrosporium novae-zelandiae]
MQSSKPASDSRKLNSENSIELTSLKSSTGAGERISPGENEHPHTYQDDYVSVDEGTLVEQREQDTQEQVTESTDQHKDATTSASTTPPLSAPEDGAFSTLRTWWNEQIAIVILEPPGDFRDYLALERTYLAFFRTSIAIAMISVAISQVFLLSDSGTPASDTDFHRFGKPLAAVLAGFALLVALMGSARYFRQQAYMSMRGKYSSGGFDILLIFIISFAVSIVVFVVSLVIPE